MSDNISDAIKIALNVTEDQLRYVYALSAVAYALDNIADAIRDAGNWNSQGAESIASAVRDAARS